MWCARGCEHPCPTSPSPFDCSDEERPRLYIQAYVRASWHADIPSTHKNVFMLLQKSRKNRDTHPRTISTTAFCATQSANVPARQTPTKTSCIAAVSEAVVELPELSQ